jgi:eukaryotic-like serine/threonine-protein kinase
MELERLGKYELVERLGSGGMGEVWKAHDTGLRRYVAIKLLHADLQANPDFVTHFMREAQLVASLQHPNIVQIHDFQLTDTQGSSVKAFMVMDYIEGGTLADYIAKTVRKGLFPPAADIVALFTAIGLALDYAHQKGMIHRDIKPENILLDRSGGAGKATGEPILTDFGIARLQGTNDSTLTRAWLGTPRYLSPEQAENRSVDKRSDLYSLGIVLYEILTGITPFRGDNPFAIMMQHVHEQPPPPTLINPNVTPALSAVVLQSIAKDPAARFPSATAMALALTHAFNLHVPASLSPTRSISQHPGYNPLQPSTPLPGMDARPLAVTNSPPVPSAPISASYPQAQISSPAISPVMNNSAKSDVQPPIAPSPKPPRRRSLYITIAASVLLLLLGISTFFAFPRLFSQHANQGTPTPGTAGDVVGTILFSSSPNATTNTFDQLKVDISHVASASAGTAYYAWLETSGSDTVYPHWQLPVSNGSVNYVYSASPQHNDLYTTSTLFLITAEDANSSPLIPNPSPARRLYYATITHPSSASPTFEIRRCPQNGTGSGVNVCQI